MTPELLAVHVQPGRDDLRLTLVGELDRSVVEMLARAHREATASHATRPIVIDVAALEFCDLGGQRELFRCQAAGATLVGDPACLRRLCSLTGDDDLLPTVAGGRWMPRS